MLINTNQIMNRLGTYSSKEGSSNKILRDIDTPDSCVKLDQQVVVTKDRFELLKIISKAHDKFDI